MKITRRGLMIAGGIGAGGAGVTAWALSRAKRPAPRPRADLKARREGQLNVLLVVSDQERSWDDYPPGFIAQHCPARHWLLENGTYLANAHTPIQLCSMARGVLYSGQHAPRNGVWENVPVANADDLSPSAPTLGTLFQDAGYITGYAGKWHLSDLERRGAKTAVRETIASYGFDEVGADREFDGPLIGFGQDASIANQANEFLKRRNGEDRPWFLAVNLVNPHDIMYYTAGADMTRSRRVTFPDEVNRPPSDPFYTQDLGYDVIGSWGPDTRSGKPEAVNEYARSMETIFGAMPFDQPAIARDFQNYYWNCTRDCDRHLGAVLSALRASGELDRTVIVFTSDHGELLGAHGLRGKGTSGYREGSRVPTVIVHPDGARGVRNDGLVSHLDFAPTLLAFAGVAQARLQEHFPFLPGIDVSALAQNAAARSPRDGLGVLLYWTSLAFLDHHAPLAFKPVFESKGVERLLAYRRAIGAIDWGKRGHMRGLFDGRYKFMRYFKPADHHAPTAWEDLTARNDLEFYDTLTDPNEANNIALDPASRDLVLASNLRVNALIRREIGVDDGAFLPDFVRR